MTIFISQLTSRGKIRPHKTRCKKCYKVFKTQEGFNIHKAIHRDKTVTSYHNKKDLYKSKKWTYET